MSVSSFEALRPRKKLSGVDPVHQTHERLSRPT
jgi:hypothetical protein